MNGEFFPKDPLPPALGKPAASDPAASDPESSPEAKPRKGPLSFLSGAITSMLLAWLCLGLSQRVVSYYAQHPPHYSSAVAQNIATAVKTLAVGFGFLATFSCAFVGVGLTLVFIRSLRPVKAAGD